MTRILKLFLLTLLFVSIQESHAQTLLHYWNFNSTTNLTSHLTPSVTNIPGAAIDTFQFSGGSSLVDVTGGTGQGFDINNYNARNSDVAGNHLRFNNPIYGALLFSLPTTGYVNAIVKYATMRSGSGAWYQLIEYTTDGSTYTFFDTIVPGTTPALYTLDFSNIAAVNNNPNFKIRFTFAQGGGGTAGNNRMDNFTLEGNPDVVQSLIHYWNFNLTTSYADHLAPTVANVTGAAIDTFLFAGGTSAVDVTGGTGQGFDINNYNVRNSDVAGNHLRFNNPIYGELRFSLPTTGYRDVTVNYATMRSGSGAWYQLVSYTTDGTSYTFFDTIVPTTTPALYTLDFSAIAATDNNANFKIKIDFAQGGGGTAGNNRIDNFTLDGYSLIVGDLIAPSVTFNPLNNATLVSINTTPTITFDEAVRLVNDSALNNTNVDTIVELRLNDSLGALVPFDATIFGNVITITPNSVLVHGQQYYVALKANKVEDLSNNSLIAVQAAKFSTPVPQTVFAAGDLALVAYRMNAAATDDEMAFVTFVDILPGTVINFTDAKYTTNTTAQCPGGLFWTAPAGGVASGTVISVKNDLGTASTGSMTGGPFGLSSGGDQCMVFTGANDSPNYITAFSSNAWLTSNTSCSGSFSNKPTPLTDGVSSIEFSTIVGNVSGNTANAYYTGTQTGTISQLKAAIMDTANWIGTTSGTTPQTWPAWAFPGPPSVVSASVLNASTILVAFNRALDSTTAIDLSHFTGIAGLSSITYSSNGSLVDTLWLNYTSSFTSATSYTLTIDSVKDDENRTMVAPYMYSFIYNTGIGFDKKFISVKEDTGSVTIKLNLGYASLSSVDLVVKSAPFSNASPTDFTLASLTLNFTGTSDAVQTITIPIIDDTLNEQDEYFVLSLENPVGLSTTSTPYMTVYIRDNDRHAPASTHQVELNYVSSFDPSPVVGSTTEIVVYDSASMRLFTTSAIQQRLDIADFSDPTNIQLVTSVDMSPYGGITSVAVKNGIVAVASPNANEQLDGSVVFFDVNGVFQKQVTVGALPDMITFTPNGSKIMTANEGQPNDAYTVDPEGSISIIDISGGLVGLSQSNVTTLLFTSFNSQEAALVASGVRKLKLTSTLSEDFEPEYITVLPNNSKAFATLQENNAIAEIDLTTNTIKGVWPLGTKDYNAFGNGFDASDNIGYVHLSNYPVKAYYIPDGIANYAAGGTQYIVTANEGDEKEYSGLNERTTVGAVTLDSAAFPQGDWLKESQNLGRLRITNLSGDTDNDGDYDELYCVGARSFTIWDATAQTKVYDSGDDFERITSTDPSIASLFNSDNESNGFKTRSRAKGPEPEGITIAKMGGETFAFVGLERVGGIMVYNITDPNHPQFVDYKNSRSLTSFTGDHAPEGITFISPVQSPDGNAYIIVANEISGTLTTYEVQNNIPPAEANFAATNATVAENSGTKTIHLNIIPKAEANGFVTVKATKGVNVTAGDFNCTPALVGDSITLPVQENDSALSFDVNVIDDVVDEQLENITFEITAVGLYMELGTGTTYTLFINDNDTTSTISIDELHAKTISMYPNPNGSGTVHFSVAADVSLYELNGQLIRSLRQTTELDVRDLAKGIYFVRINGVLNKKLVIE